MRPLLFVLALVAIACTSASMALAGHNSLSIQRQSVVHRGHAIQQQNVVAYAQPVVVQQVVAPPTYVVPQNVIVAPQLQQQQVYSQAIVTQQLNTQCLAGGCNSQALRSGGRGRSVAVSRQRIRSR